MAMHIAAFVSLPEDPPRTRAPQLAGPRLSVTRVDLAHILIGNVAAAFPSP